MINLVLDFDGVIHSYKSGWEGVEVITDPPVSGAIDFIRKILRDERFVLFIFSSRSQNPEGLLAMRKYLLDNGLSVSDVSKIHFPSAKPAAFLTIDDRAFCFNGDFPDLEEITKFKPWNKRDRKGKCLRCGQKLPGPPKEKDPILNRFIAASLGNDEYAISAWSAMAFYNLDSLKKLKAKVGEAAMIGDELVRVSGPALAIMQPSLENIKRR